MHRMGTYSRDCPGALGSPPALPVLCLHIALGSLLQDAGHVLVHHVGTEGSAGEKCALDCQASARRAEAPILAPLEIPISFTRFPCC